ncbi:MAG: N-acetyltransferase [Pseudomonadota bacterium]
MTGGSPIAEIIEAGVAHAAVIAVLHRDCLGEAWSQASVAQLLALPGAFALIAIDDAGRPAGFAICLGAGESAPEDVELLAIGVVPDRRRRGVGSTLLSECLLRSARAGAQAMLLEVAEDNRIACAFYGRFGFSRFGRRADYYGPGRDAVLLRCEVTAQAGAPHAAARSRRFLSN